LAYRSEHHARGKKSPLLPSVFVELLDPCLERLDRKNSRDGKKRAKLNAAMTGIFIERLKTIDCTMDSAGSMISDMSMVCWPSAPTNLGARRRIGCAQVNRAKLLEPC
jgi:hypothetical protein